MLLDAVEATRGSTDPSGRHDSPKVAGRSTGFPFSQVRQRSKVNDHVMRLVTQERTAFHRLMDMLQRFSWQNMPCHFSFSCTTSCRHISYVQWVLDEC